MGRSKEWLKEGLGEQLDGYNNPDEERWVWHTEFRLGQFIALGNWWHYQNGECLKGWKV